MRKIQEHIIHCSDSEIGDATTIDKWHKKRGFRKIGYHFVILPDGRVEIGRDVSEIGAHCKGFNRYSVGTCLIGVDRFTQAQFESLKKVHQFLQSIWPSIHIKNHYEHNSRKSCPNFDVHLKIKG